MINREVETIKRILQILPKSKFHLNPFFESDSEVIDYQGKKLLFSIDEFSQEDFFRDNHPYPLGWNLAVSTISDILACGGKPVLYAHSMTISHKLWNDTFIDLFSKGIADVLGKCSAGFIGGDIGSSECWHYTGVAIGEAENPLSRKGAEPGHLIYMTGFVGSGNLEAAIKLNANHKLLKPLLNNYSLVLPCRIKESELIKQYATACIDSSDGLFNVLNTIADVNNVGYEISNIPYLRDGVIACKILGKPKAVLALGECGEYELIFTIKKENEQAFLNTSKEMHLTFNKIGELTEKSRRVIKTQKDDIDMNGFNIKARNYDKIDDYLVELVEFAKSIN
jgi:thiamine-monophosphate kinase